MNATDTTSSRYLAGWDAAVDYTTLSRATLIRAEKHGRLKPIRVGSRVLFTREQLDEFIASYGD
jgi:excisionase family DNA binding protein